MRTLKEGRFKSTSVGTQISPLALYHFIELTPVRDLVFNGGNSNADQSIG